MNTELSNFVFPVTQANVRVSVKNGEPWFCLADVCEILGLGNTAMVASRIDDQEGINSVDTPTKGGVQSITFINEPSLYEVILTSRVQRKSTETEADVDVRKERVKSFKRWVTHEVLPTIRKTGTYSINAGQPVLPTNVPNYHQLRYFIDGYGGCLDLLGIGGNSKAIAMNNQAKQYFGVDLLATAGQTYLTSEVQEQHLNPSDIAQRLGNGMTNKSVNLLLTKVGLQTASRDAKNRIVYDLTEAGKQYGEYMDTGKKHSDGRPIRQIRWYVSVVDRLR